MVKSMFVQFGRAFCIIMTISCSISYAWFSISRPLLMRYELPRTMELVSDGQPPLTDTRQGDAPVFWLHIEKTGTSLINAVYRRFCPLAPLDPSVAYGDVSIIKQWPPSEWCPGAFLNPEKAFGYHWPITARSPVNATCTMLRDPVSRSISAFHFGPRHRPSGLGKTPASWKNSTMAEYLSTPGIVGCQAKMLTGRHCGAPGTMAKLDREEAVARVERLLYFGLTDDWEESIVQLRERLGDVDGLNGTGVLGNMRPRKQSGDQSRAAQRSGYTNQQAEADHFSTSEGECEVYDLLRQLDDPDLAVFERAYEVFQDRSTREWDRRDTPAIRCGAKQ